MAMRVDAWRCVVWWCCVAMRAMCGVLTMVCHVRVMGGEILFIVNVFQR